MQHCCVRWRSSDCRLTKFSPPCTRPFPIQCDSSISVTTLINFDEKPVFLSLVRFDVLAHDSAASDRFATKHGITFPLELCCKTKSTSRKTFFSSTLVPSEGLNLERGESDGEKGDTTESIDWAKMRRAGEKWGIRSNAFRISNDCSFLTFCGLMPETPLHRTGSFVPARENVPAPTNWLQSAKVMIPCVCDALWCWHWALLSIEWGHRASDAALRCESTCFHNLWFFLRHSLKWKMHLWSANDQLNYELLVSAA